MIFRLADYGAVFSTRARGLKLRAQLLQECVGPTVVSLEGVEGMSYSFADEFVAALISARGDIALQGVAPQLRPVIRSALKRRGVKDAEHRIEELVAA